MEIYIVLTLEDNRKTYLVVENIASFTENMQNKTKSTLTFWSDSGKYLDVQESVGEIAAQIVTVQQNVIVTTKKLKLRAIQEKLLADKQLFNS